jgi:hypothetical protein
LNAVFLEWMEQLQKCVQVDGEYVEWDKRTQYIEIDFNHEIFLYYTWRGTPYMMHNGLENQSNLLMYAELIYIDKLFPNQKVIASYCWYNSSILLWGDENAKQ